VSEASVGRFSQKTFVSRENDRIPQRSCDSKDERRNKSPLDPFTAVCEVFLDCDAGATKPEGEIATIESNDNRFGGSRDMSDKSQAIEMQPMPQLENAMFSRVTFTHCRLPATFILSNNFENCRWVDVTVSDAFYGNTFSKEDPKP
jgi:hypothetical protein